MSDTAREWHPSKGTPEFDLLMAAIDIAADAPLRQGTNVSRAGIWWWRIDNLRKALDEMGIDWRKVKAEKGKNR